MANSTGLSVFIEGDAIEIEAGSLSYGLFTPKYDPKSTIKAGQRATIASEKMDNNLQSVTFRMVLRDLDKLRNFIYAKSSNGLNVSLTNGNARYDYKNMFVSDDTDLMVEDNGQPFTEITLTGTQVV
ncbi:hypothetical protein [Neisseria sp. Ec49-e6-T10]|uniref:hypothetical protein n=1 Tax=Neisseria sp. Ec49-e6-T10 TaxID=3140744 RepID=UPI003EBA1B11